MDLLSSKKQVNKSKVNESENESPSLLLTKSEPENSSDKYLVTIETHPLNTHNSGIKPNAI